MIKMGKGYTNENLPELCSELNTERACIVVDAIHGSLPRCMKELSVYHNVGIFDTASKGILSWGNLSTPNGCPKTVRRKPAIARPKTAKPLGVKSTGVTKPTTAAAQRRAEEKAAEVKAARRAATIKRLAEEKAAKEKAARNAANAASRQIAARSARVVKRGRNN